MSECLHIATKMIPPRNRLIQLSINMINNKHLYYDRRHTTNKTRKIFDITIINNLHNYISSNILKR